LKEVKLLCIFYNHRSINSKEKSFLMELVQCSYLPVSRFIMSSSIEEEARFVGVNKRETLLS
jgi:hypothetical protein